MGSNPTPAAWVGPRSGLALHPEDYDGTVWLGRPDCTPHLQVGDGPSPNAAEGRCVDTIMSQPSADAAAVTR